MNKIRFMLLAGMLSAFCLCAEAYDTVKYTGNDIVANWTLASDPDEETAEAAWASCDADGAVIMTGADNPRNFTITSSKAY